LRKGQIKRDEGEGGKEEKVEIQAELQIGKEEELWIL
jgi:hypothetical protein